MPRITASPALSHLRVLDLTRVRAGPTCVRIFADFGADVIKIETPPGTDRKDGIGGPRHGFDMQNLHRNKRSITLNLKTPEGLEIFKRLVVTADIVVENYRPDVKARLGIGYDELRAINKRIILASISGFGETGPYRMRAGPRPDRAGNGRADGVTGCRDRGRCVRARRLPIRPSGIYAAIGILVALAERERSGEGQWVATSLLQAQIAMMDFQAARYLVDGQVPEQVGNNHPYVTPTGAFETADGYINIALGGGKQWRNFCESIERPDLAVNPDYATQEDRLRHRDALNVEIASALRDESLRAAWIDILGTAEIPLVRFTGWTKCLPIRRSSISAWLRRYIIPSAAISAWWLSRCRLSRTPAAIATPIAEMGAHTGEMLTELGYSAGDMDRLRASRII